MGFRARMPNAECRTNDEEHMSVETLIRDWDGETVIVRHDKPTGAWMYIAIHSTRLGMAGGGTRMKSYRDQDAALADVLKLSAAMTSKFALAGLPQGGGKAVIALPPGFNPEARPDLLRRYGALVRQLDGLFTTAPDVGTTSEDMDVVAETGTPYIFGRTTQSGGTGSSGPFTGLGIFAGIRTSCEHIFGDASLKGRRVLVQGAGEVGASLIAHLVDAGAEVLFTDISESAIRRHKDEMNLAFIRPESEYDIDCDVFAPCALGGILNADTIPRLRCRIVAGGANNQLAEPEDVARLKERGILYAPDYAVNAGGAIGLLGMETMGWSHADAEREVAARISRTLQEIFRLAGDRDVTTDEAARVMAEARLQASV